MSPDLSIPNLWDHHPPQIVSFAPPFSSDVNVSASMALQAAAWPSTLETFIDLTRD